VRLTYDPRYNIAYIALREGPAEVETVHVGEELTVDIDADGAVVGIEFLNANQQLKGPSGLLEVVNEASGETDSLRLAV
jgi:uncharacterized protein YuzE